MKKELQVMNIFRLPPLGKIAIEIGQNRYEAFADIEDPKAQRIIMAAIGELIDFVGGYDVLAKDGFAPMLQHVQKQEQPLEAQQAAFLANLEAERDAMKEQNIGRSGSILGGIRPSLPSDHDQLIEQQTKRKLTIVEQIDQIIQGYLQQIPELADRSVHLQQNPLGGLRIRVDDTYYERPGDVEDKRIRLLIKKALKDWESKDS